MKTSLHNLFTLHENWEQEEAEGERQDLDVPALLPLNAISHSAAASFVIWRNSQGNEIGFCGFTLLWR